MPEKKDLKYSIMDKALGVKQSVSKSIPSVQSLKKKPVSKSKPAPKPVKKSVQEKNHSSLIGIAVIFLIVVVALIFVLDDSLDLDLVDAGKENQPSSADEIPENQEEIKLSFDERYTECASKPLVQHKDECLQNLAVEFNKEFLCDELTNLDLEKCRRLVWKANAVVSLEIEKCSELLTELDKIECIKEIALLSSDKTICSKITEVVSSADLTQVNSCYIALAVQEKDLSVCDLIEGSMKDTCKFNTAVVISNPDLCIGFEVPTIRNDCIARIAKNLNDVSLCNRISSSIQKNKCIKDLS